MTSTTHISPTQRIALSDLMRSRLKEFERVRATQLQGLTQVDSARQTLLQDADDARQRSGEHEVESIVSDIDSGQFNELRAALERVHDSDYGVCIDCQEAISFERLRLEPQALRCTACQTLHERDSLS